MSSVWPRRYTPAELEAIAKSIGRSNLPARAVDKLQEAVKAYQWGCSVDYGKWGSPSTNKDRRKSLKNIITLCEQEAPAEEIEIALNELDVVASQLFGAVDSTDPRNVQIAARAALKEIRTSGPDPKRARRQYIGDLVCIYSLATGKRPGRWVHDIEGGEFRDFVRAALEPFKATQGCEGDIKVALKRSKHA
jgi:hypothetical protein